MSLGRVETRREANGLLVVRLSGSGDGPDVSPDLRPALTEVRRSPPRALLIDVREVTHVGAYVRGVVVCMAQAVTERGGHARAVARSLSQWNTWFRTIAEAVPVSTSYEETLADLSRTDLPPLPARPASPPPSPPAV